MLRGKSIPKTIETCGLGVWGLNKSRANDLVGELARRRGCMVPAYKMPPDEENGRIMRMLVKFNQTRELVDALADDFPASIKYLRAKSGGKNSGPPARTGHGY